jgi:uncharacterized membrane protein
MKPRLPWILFVISLALNLFFAAGVFYNKLEAERLSAAPEQRIGALAEQLGLSEAQQAGLLALREQAMERREAVRGLRQQRRAALMAELAKPELDRERLGQLMREGMERRAAAFEQLLVDLHGYLATLSDEQRAAFLEMAKERGFLRGLYGWRRTRN